MADGGGRLRAPRRRVDRQPTPARPKRKNHKSLETYLGSIQGDDSKQERICVDELDVVMMRNDPAVDLNERPWAVASGVLFGQLTVAKGTLVVNDPANLANAVNKTYFQHFPEAVRPRTLISRDPAEIAAFVRELGANPAVLKPLQGSGGASVFLVSSDESPNLNQMIEAIARDGYIVAQEFLPEAEQGDIRLFVMNGEPLRRGDQLRRVPAGEQGTGRTFQHARRRQADTRSR